MRIETHGQHHHRVAVLAFALGALLLSAGIAGGACASDSESSMDVARLLRETKVALEPSRPSLREIEISVRSSTGETITWDARQARRQLDDGSAAMVTVLLDPAGVRGVAVLAVDRPGAAMRQWAYLPPVRRLRELTYSGRYHAFLGTDLTYEDLGFWPADHGTVTLVESTTFDGAKVHVVREVPDNQMVYSKVLMWIDAATHAPLRREYYDPAGALWRVVSYERPTVIDGVPTSLGLSVEDVQAGGSTRLQVTRVTYDADLPAELFEPEKLPVAVQSAVWKSRD
jgi:hypothetical protein